MSLFFIKSALVMSYYVCFTYTFIEYYCVNKDKPDMHCDDKCQLSKLLKQDSTEQDNQNHMMLTTSAEIVFYLSKTKNTFRLSKFEKESKPFFVYKPQLYILDF